jgi:streptogramin lyase
VLRLPGRAISVAPPRLGDRAALAKMVLDVTVKNSGHGPVAVRRSDFSLSASGDMFAMRKWDAGRSLIRIAPARSRSLRLTFGAASAGVQRVALVYRPAGGGPPGALPLDGRSAFAVSPRARASAQPNLETFPITGGVGDPWGTAVDSSGNIWFAEPGCDFAPTCAPDARPGQIGKLNPSSGAFTHYTLPAIPGNQPIFVAFDNSGSLWFTTPNNSMIGEFSPSTGTFVGQWPVTGGSGPWDLIFANGQVWYTEHFASAVGAFDPASHTHQDFQTPSPNSNPYGIAASGGLIWFTENNSSVDQIAVLDTAGSNAIAEYPIVRPLSGTPHLIGVDATGHPWWTEGWSDTIATLDPAVATPGSCGTGSGTCKGVQRFRAPPAATCGGGAHTSGIALEDGADRVWFDNSLTAQVGSFTPSAGTFVMTTLSNCGAHPHDGLGLDTAGDVWFAEEFGNALGELIAPPSGSAPTGGPPASVATPSAATQPAPANTAAPAIRGSPRQARTLTASSGSWTNNPTGFSYAWQRCDPGCVTVPRATSASYKLGARDVDAEVRVIVTASNAGGSGQAASPIRGPVGTTLTRVQISLGRLLADGTRGWTIDKLLRAGGYTVGFHAPSAGSVRMSWHVVPRRTLIATGKRRFSKASARSVAIRLTRRGRRLLERVTKLTFTVKVVYRPSGEPAVSSVKRLTLRGRQRAA